MVRWLLRKRDERRLARALRARSRMSEWQMTLTLSGRRDFEGWRIPHNDILKVMGSSRV